MILTVHFLTGAALVSKIQPIPLALFLAFLSHYFLDFLPHPDEYSISNIKEKRWRKSFFDFLKISLDISLGIILIFFFSKNFSLALIGGLVAALPDAFTLLGLITPNKLLMVHEILHRKIHFLKNPEGPRPLCSNSYSKQPIIINNTSGGLIKKTYSLEDGANGAGKKISPFWGIITEIIIFFLAIYFLQ